MDKQKVRRAPRLLGRAASIAVRLWNEEHLHRLLVGTRRFVLCALLMQANVFDSYAPFGLAMASAMMAHGAGLSAVGGVVCGAMLIDDGLLGGVYVAATLIVLCVMSVCTGLRVVQRPWFAPAVAAAAGAACTFIFLPSGDELRAPAVLTFLAVQGLTFGACRIYGAALAPPREEGDWRRPVTLLAVTATVLLSLAHVSLFGLFAPARAAALLLVLGTAYLGGPAVGAAAGVAFGAVMDLGVGAGALFTCCYGLCALAAGLFRDGGRARFAVCAFTSGLCASMLGTGSDLFIPLLSELTAAVLLFASLPEAVWNALRRTLLPETLVGEKTRLKLRRAAGHCATEAAQAFYELYLAMLSGAAEGRAAGDENLRVVFDRASDRVCKSCVLCAQCWQKDYVTTLAALNDVTQPMLARGRAEMQDFPYHFSSRCVHLPELIRAINSALFALRERQSLRRQQEENRSLLARQYAGITDILRQLGAEVTQDVTAQPMMEKQIRRYAAAFGWIDRVCAVRDAQGRLIVELYGDGIADILRQGEGFSAGLSALLDVALTEPREMENEFGTCLEMHERAPFRAVVGIGRQQRSGVSVSGDSGCWFLTDAGVACLLLADGMGSGAAAAQDSRMLVSSMERFLRAGIPLGDALGAVSPALRLRSDGTRFVTLDALTLDLFTGQAESLKCGAAPSYVRTDGRWSVLAGKSLPVGLSDEKNQSQSVPLRLSHGDLFIMVSDGVSDGLDDAWVRELLREHGGEGPKELAARLVTEARGRGSDDDRTAIVMRVEKTNF